MSQKNLVFIFRSYNDIDHITPIIDKILKNGLANVSIFCRSIHLENLLINENIFYLQKTYGLSLKPICNEISLIHLAINFTTFCHQSVWKSFKNVKYIIKIFSKITYLVIHLLQTINGLLCRRKTLLTILNESPDTICIDWTDLNLFPYDIIWKFSTDRKIPLIELPHGFNVFSERLNFSKAKNIKQSTLQIFPDESNKQHFIDFGHQGHQIVIGCPRFTSEWIQKKQSFQDFKPTFNSSSLNFAILMNKLLYRGYSSEIKAMLILFSKTAFVYVKPHTRNMCTDFLTNLPKNVYILDSSTTSTSLIKGSDLSFFWGSSIGIEVIAQYLPFLYPKFVHGYKTIYEKYFPDRIVSSLDELESRLSSDYSIYQRLPEGRVSSFMEEYVYANHTSRDPGLEIAKRILNSNYRELF